MDAADKFLSSVPMYNSFTSKPEQHPWLKQVPGTPKSNKSVIAHENRTEIGFYSALFLINQLKGDSSLGEYLFFHQCTSHLKKQTNYYVLDNDTTDLRSFDFWEF